MGGTTTLVVTAADLAMLGVTPEAVTYVFSWGVAAVLGLWSMGFALGCAIQAINKA